MSEGYTRAMGVRVHRYEETPNPNALKCVLSGPMPPPAAIEKALRSYASLDAARAAGDDLAAALLAIPGVTGVLLTPGWITVSKAGPTSWARVKPAVADAIARLT